MGMSAADRLSSQAVDLGQLAEETKAREQDAHGVSGFVEITQQNLETELLRRSVQVPVIALIGSARSEESEQLKSDLEALAHAQERTQFVVGYIDADAQPRLAAVLGARVLPTLLALAAGRPVASLEGGQPREQLAAWVAALIEQVGPQLQGLPDQVDEEEVDPRLAEAAVLADSGDFDEALKAYDAILAEGPNPQATQARGLTVVRQRLATNDGEQSAEPEVFVAADRAVVSGQPEAAFDLLLEAMRSATGSDKAATKDRLISLFQIYGNADVRVQRARSAMASALF